VSTRSRALTIAALVSLSLSGGAGVAQETVPVFLPEITLSLTCYGDMATREHALQQFLRAHGFNVLDLSRGNDNSGRTFPQNATTVGIDELEHFGRKHFQCTVESVHYGHNFPSEADAYEQSARELRSAIRDASRR
jgi:hypothetical protein